MPEQQSSVLTDLLTHSCPSAQGVDSYSQAVDSSRCASTSASMHP